jgi:drug/metabolite transporter (DMT)-like permease
VGRKILVSNEVLGIILAFSAACCWGSAGVLYKAVIKADHSLYLSMVYRGIIAVPFLAFLTVLTTGFDAVAILLQFDVLPILLLSSLFVTLGDLVFFGSLQRIDVSKAQPVASMYPLFTIGLLIVFGVEEVSLIVILATIILILGIGFVSQQKRTSLNLSSSTTAVNSQGLTLAISAAGFWSLGILTLDHLLAIPGIDVFSLATIRFGILTVLMALSWIIFDKIQLFSSMKTKTQIPISKRDVLIFGLTGILSWGLGAVTFFNSIEIIGASRATPISSINPLIAVILGVLVLKERFSHLQAFGIILVCVGSIIISLV